MKYVKVERNGKEEKTEKGLRNFSQSTSGRIANSIWCETTLILHYTIVKVTLCGWITPEHTSMFKPMFETLYHIILRQLSSGNLSPVHYSFLSKVPCRHTSLQTAPLVWYGSEATESVHRRRGVDLQRPLAQHRLQGLCLHTTEITKNSKLHHKQRAVLVELWG